MTADHVAAGRIAGIRETIGQALEHWDSSNAAAMAACELLLEQSAADFQSFYDDLRTGAKPAVGARVELLNIKASIEKFIRVVDAASAFASGLSGTVADRGISYDATGTAQRIGCVGGNYDEGQGLCRTF